MNRLLSATPAPEPDPTPTTPPSTGDPMPTVPSVFLPAKVRGVVYAVYAVVGVLATATSVAFATAEVLQPLWFKVALAVYVFLGPAIGFTAASNTPAAPSAVASNGESYDAKHD